MNVDKNNHFEEPHNNLANELYKSEEYCQLILENIHEVVFKCDNSGLLTYLNQSWERVLGYFVTESLGHSIADFLHEEDRDSILAFISTEEKHCELRFRHRNGETVWLEMSACKDHKMGNIGLLHDITARKSLEYKLGVERKKLFAILDRLPAFVYLRDKDFYITFCNSYFIDQFGDGFMKLCYEVIPCDKDLCNLCPSTDVFRTNIHEVWEWEDPDTNLNYQIYDYPFEDIDGTQLVLKLGIDITDRKKSEASNGEIIRNLERSLSAIKTLKGFLPICASCKKIRDDKGFWNQVDDYISMHSDVEFTHSICPDCKNTLYPELKGLD